MTNIARRHRTRLSWRLAFVAMFLASNGSSQVITGRNWCQQNFVERAQYVYSDRLPSMFRAPVDAAAATWTSVTSCDFATSHGSGPIARYDETDLINSIDYGLVGDSEAKAITYCRGEDREFRMCDIMFNTAWGGKFSTNPGPGEISIQGVAVHEFGHWLELDESHGVLDVMNPANQDYGRRVHTLSGADESGCRTIYPDGFAPWQSPPCLKGTCCKLSGAACFVTDPYQCVDGQFQVDKTCGEVTCPSVGACCLHPDSTSCTVLPEWNCVQQGGLWHGETQSCAVCAPPPEPTTAVCCTPSHVCYVSVGLTCEEGDTLKTFGSSCDNVVCNSGGTGTGGGTGTSYEPDGCWLSGCQEMVPRDDDDGGSTGSPNSCPEETAQAGLNASGTVDAENLEYGPPVGCQTCVGGLGRALLRGLRSQMFQSAGGLRYVGLYAYHSPQVLSILENNPTIRTHAANMINDFMPAVRSYLYSDVRGNDFTLTAARLAEIQEVVNEIKSHASNGLQADLDRFMALARAQQDLPFSEATTNMLRQTP